MIYTSSHNAFKPKLPFRTYAISGDHGRSAGYIGEFYSDLAPKMSFWKEWKANVGIVPELENNYFYIKKYWETVLSFLDPQEIFDELDGSVLLCYEPGDKFCHRHIVAAWFELLLNKTIPEIEMNRLQFNCVTRPQYIKLYLERVIKESRNMNGLTSLRALYLLDKAECFEKRASELERYSNKSQDSMRQKACFLRCESIAVEYEHAIKF